MIFVALTILEPDSCCNFALSALLSFEPNNASSCWTFTEATVPWTVTWSPAFTFEPCAVPTGTGLLCPGTVNVNR